MHTSALTLSCDWQVCDMLMSPPPASSCSLKRETSDLSLSREDLLVTLECDDLLFSSSVTWKLSHQICIKNLPLETLTTNRNSLVVFFGLVVKEAVAAVSLGNGLLVFGVRRVVDQSRVAILFYQKIEFCY